MIARVLLALLAALAADVETAWRELDAAPADAWSERRDAVLALGEEAALAGLATFASADANGRRTRAEVCRRAGGTRCVAPARALLDDVDPGVRRELVRFLGRRDLGAAAGAERLDALAERVREDLDAEVRALALESLATVEHPDALARLDELLDELPGTERVIAARLLADRAGAREIVVRRVEEAFSGERDRAALDTRSLALFLDEYGDALAQLPGGGTVAAERRPLVLGREHPAPIVRVAARSALDRLLGRLAQLGDFERVASVLDGFAEDGLDPLDLSYRRAFLALTQGPDPADAAPAARAILRLTRHRDDLEGREWRVRGALLLAAAQIGTGEIEASRDSLDEAARVVDALLGERLDLLPDLRNPSTAGADSSVGYVIFRALVELWRATALLAEGKEPSDGAVLALLRGMYVIGLEAELLAVTTRSDVPADGLQALLDDPLGPRRLLLSNPDSATWPPERAHALQLALGRALAGVSAFEMPGFEPASDDPASIDPLRDPVRLDLLLRIQSETAEALSEELREEAQKDRPDEMNLLRLRQMYFYLARTEIPETRELLDRRHRGEEDPSRVPTALYRYRVPTNFALELAYDLRGDGSSAEARELSERMLADLRANSARGQGTLNDWLVARIEVSIGSSWMDEKDPVRAEREFLRAEKRLQAMEDGFDQDMREEEDPSRRASYRGMIATTRSLRADTLLSLAVNANVRMDDQERALAYFERAFELKQTDFMRVLLACYRARSGRAGEARAVLAEVTPTPPLYYNLACTHALLGDVDLGLDYLARELAENHATERARNRQKQWAAEDPDLANLRGDPRFERLVEIPDADD